MITAYYYRWIVFADVHRYVNVKSIIGMPWLASFIQGAVDQHLIQAKIQHQYQMLRVRWWGIVSFPAASISFIVS
jgi:hypothetical protein